MELLVLQFLKFYKNLDQRERKIIFVRSDGGYSDMIMDMRRSKSNMEKILESLVSPLRNSKVMKTDMSRVLKSH